MVKKKTKTEKKKETKQNTEWYFTGLKESVFAENYEEALKLITKK